MKKGFTLIELLAVLVVLSVIMLISIPVITPIFVSSRDKAYAETISNIEDAAHLYVIKNMKDFSTTIGAKNFVTIRQLKDAGLLKEGITDARSGEVIEDGEVLVVLNSEGDYTYDYLRLDYTKPNLVLWYDAIKPGNVNTTWEDLSGNGKHGTLANFLFNSSSGWQSNYLAFSSSLETITAANPLITQTVNLQSYTVLITFNLTASSTITPRMIGINNGLNLVYSTTNRALHYINSGANDYYTYSISNTPINQTMQYAFRFNKNTSTNIMKVEILKNGVAESANNFAENLARLPVGMASNITLNNMTNIKLYSVKIYDKVLTDAELLKNYTVDKERFNF